MPNKMLQSDGRLCRPQLNIGCWMDPAIAETDTEQMGREAFEYVGPRDIAEKMRDVPPGSEIRDRESLVAWVNLNSEESTDAGLWATYTVGLDGVLRVASRRSEHVACAGGEAVLGAGELCVTPNGEVVEISNQSTGYCPDTTWLDRRPKSAG